MSKRFKNQAGDEKIIHWLSVEGPAECLPNIYPNNLDEYGQELQRACKTSAGLDPQKSGLISADSDALRITAGYEMSSILQAVIYDVSKTPSVRRAFGAPISQKNLTAIRRQSVVSKERQDAPESRRPCEEPLFAEARR